MRSWTNVSRASARLILSLHCQLDESKAERMVAAADAAPGTWVPLFGYEIKREGKNFSLRKP